MSIKIIGGEARGFSLNIPPESITRPTSVLLKRRLFDYYQNLNGYYFIDLCAGSGGIGFEAASRGASATLMLESNEKAFNILKSNLSRFIERYKELNIDIRIEKNDFRKWFDKFKEFYGSLDSEEKKNIILFFDPPYDKTTLYDDFFSQIESLDFKGITIIEACRQKTMSEEDFSEKYGVPTRNYRQGTSFLYLYDYN